MVVLSKVDGPEVRFTLSDGELLKALGEAPSTVAYNLRRAFGRIGAEFKKRHKAAQSSAAMRRLQRKAVLVIHTPKRGGFKNVRALVQGKGDAGAVRTSIFSFSEVAEAHEKGLTVRRGSPGMPVRFPRRYSQLAKSLAQAGGRGGMGITGALLRELQKDTTKRFVLIKGRSGKLTVFEDKSPREPRNRVRGVRGRRSFRKRKLQPIATFHNEVTLKPTFRFFKTFDEDGYRNKHLNEARNAIIKRLESRRSRRRG